MTDKAALPDAWSPFGKTRGPRDPELNYLEKGVGLLARTRRRPAENFFSASFSLPPKKLPFPAIIFDGQLKTRHAPGTSFEPYPIPVLADPKKIIGALDQLRALKTFASADAVNTTTGPGVA